jgi:hypothetical protein
MYVLITMLMTSMSLYSNTIFSDDLSRSEQLQQAINALNYARTENKEIADKMNALLEQTETAVEQRSVSTLIDIIIQSLLFAAGRIKHYEENFQDYVLGIQEESETLQEYLDHHERSV